jgi:hypothetical protein
MPLPVRSGRFCRRVRRPLLVGWIAAAVLAQVGCGDADYQSAAPPGGSVAPGGVTPASASASTPVASPTMGPLLAPAETARMLASYRQFWAVVTTASQTPPSSWRRALSAVSAEPLLSQLLDGLIEQTRKGLVDYGTITVHPRIVRVDARHASIVDCQDASRSGTLETDTGVAKTVGSARTPFSAVLIRGADGRWRLSEGRLLGDSC